MRPIGFADLEVAMRALLFVDESQRYSVMMTLIGRAQAADRYRKTLGCPHPEFGTGTLMSATQAFAMQPRPAYLATDELNAIATIVTALLAQHVHQSA